METLGNYINIRTGKLDANAADENGEYPFFTCAVNPLRINIAAFDCECVLVAGNGDLNVKYYTGKFNAYQRTYIIESKDNRILSPKYVFRFLDKSLRQLRSQTRGGVIQYLRLNDLTDLKFDLPSIDKQLQISTILSKAENLISQRKQSITLLDEFLKSTFLEMFGDPVRNEKCWKIQSFEELVAKDCPLTYGIVQPGIEFPDGIPVIRPVDLKQTFIIREGLKLIDPKISGQFKRTVLKGGELLMCVRGTTGVTSIASQEVAGCNVTRGITPIWFSENYNTLFAFHLLQSQAIRNKITELTYGATLQQINLGDLRKIMLINPEITLQNQFAKIAEKTEALKSQYQSSLQELENLYGSLSQQAFKGELKFSETDT